VSRRAPAWRGELKRLFPGAKFDDPLSKYTTYRIGGPGDAVVTVRSVTELRRLLVLAGKRRLPVFPIGWGSNMLIRDGGIRGIVLRFAGDFTKVRFVGGNRVWAGCAVRLPQLVIKCAQRGLQGAEPLVGVPGCVGGSLVMNAGTRFGEIGDFVISVDCFDRVTRQEVNLPRNRIRFRYRSSSLKKRLILGALLELKPGNKVDIIETVRKFQQQRLKTQPVHSFNVGSVFKNPPGHFVAKLVQEAGLKGHVEGGARVSPKHANFIENHDHALATDVLRLVRLIRRKVRETSGIALELEMKVVGEAAL
jgi:UDP-N-acetylmuramate dehydrogenase